MKACACEFQDVTNDIRSLIGHAITQIPVNSNIATTGHKLQGMSKNTLIVNNWDYKFVNWVYVVLSRVRTRKGLFLMAAGHEQGLQCSTKATRLRGQNEAMQGATHPGQTFQGRCDQASEDDVTVEY